MSINKLVSTLEKAVPSGVSVNVELAPLSRWKIGGAAAVFVEPANAEEVACVLGIMSERTEPLFIMGDASNVLFDSKGFKGVVMRIGRRMSRMSITGTEVWAQAGIWVPKFARAVGCAGLSGIEHTIGIPGTLGGLVTMNGGSQRKGIGLNVQRVKCANEEGSICFLEREECCFSYRSSKMQKGYVILETELNFIERDKGDTRREMIDILRSRRTKFPKNLPNCGSTFLSNPAMYDSVGPPGRAIEMVGLKGTRRGDAEISPLHANFIVNLGRASSDDVLWLIAKIRAEVSKSTGYLMDCEVRYLSPEGLLRPAHEAAEEQWNTLIGGAEV